LSSVIAAISSGFFYVAGAAPVAGAPPAGAAAGAGACNALFAGAAGAALGF